MASHCAEGNILMDNLIEKTMAINEQEAAYSQEVPLDLHLKGADYVDAPDTIIVLNFEIEVDYRSWGIKDINVSIRGGIDVEVEAGDQVIPVKVDFLEVTPKITWVEGSGYVPSDVHVTLNEDFTVESVEVDFYYLVP